MLSCRRVLRVWHGECPHRCPHQPGVRHPLKSGQEVMRTDGDQPVRAGQHLRGQGPGAVVGQVELGYGPDGRRQYKRVTGRKKDTVLAKMRAVQAAKDRGMPTPDQTVTTCQWLEQWLSDVLPATVSAGTERNDRDIVRFYVLPHVGGSPWQSSGRSTSSACCERWKPRDCQPAPVDWPARCCGGRSAKRSGGER
jgi:hypothetical protein